MTLCAKPDHIQFDLFRVSIVMVALRLADYPADPADRSTLEPPSANSMSDMNSGQRFLWMFLPLDFCRFSFRFPHFLGISCCPFRTQFLHPLRIGFAPVSQKFSLPFGMRFPPFFRLLNNLLSVLEVVLAVIFPVQFRVCVWHAMKNIRGIASCKESLNL